MEWIGHYARIQQRQIPTSERMDAQDSATASKPYTNTWAVTAISCCENCKKMDLLSSPSSAFSYTGNGCAALWYSVWMCVSFYWDLFCLSSNFHHHAYCIVWCKFSCNCCSLCACAAVFMCDNSLPSCFLQQHNAKLENLSNIFIHITYNLCAYHLKCPIVPCFGSHAMWHIRVLPTHC